MSNNIRYLYLEPHFKISKNIPLLIGDENHTISSEMCYAFCVHLGIINENDKTIRIPEFLYFNIKTANNITSYNNQHIYYTKFTVIHKNVCDMCINNSVFINRLECVDILGFRYGIIMTKCDTIPSILMLYNSEEDIIIPEDQIYRFNYNGTWYYAFTSIPSIIPFESILKFSTDNNPSTVYVNDNDDKIYHENVLFRDQSNIIGRNIPTDNYKSVTIPITVNNIPPIEFSINTIKVSFGNNYVTSDYDKMFIYY